MLTKVQFAVDKQMIFFAILLKLYKYKLYYVSLIKPKFLNLVDKISKKDYFYFFKKLCFSIRHYAFYIIYLLEVLSSLIEIL